MSPAVRDEIKQLLGPRWTTRLGRLIRGQERPRWGNFRRVRPFSESFGFDRGAPIDRHYLRAFLEAHRDVITGDGHRLLHSWRR